MADTQRKGAVVTSGLGDLIRAFQVANREVAKDVKTALEQAGEPIRQEAQQRVLASVSGMARSRIPWHSIRAGVAGSSVGYIVPARRRSVGSKRRNLAPLIADQEQLALDNNRDRVLQEFDEALTEVAKAWARV